jgi:hypothetical protein
LTAFPASDAKVESEGWWERVAGAPADVRTVKAKELMTQEEGDYEGGKLVLSLRVGRVDWLWAGEATPAGVQAGELPSLGAYEEVCRKFHEMMDRWLDVSPPLVRLAVGTIMDQRVSSKNEAYGILGGKLPGVQLDARSTDFLYQINRPISCRSLPEQEINQLIKWAALRFQVVTQGLETSRESFSVRLELDINTSKPQSDRVFERSDARKVLAELIEVANGIVQEEQPR